MRRIFLVLIMVLLLIPTLGNNHVSASGFNDVPTSHGFYKEITFLVERGVFSQSAQFGVDKKVTREEMAVVVSKAVGLTGGRTNTPFKDVPSSLESSGYINSAVEAGIVSGYKDGTFRPNELVSRGQMAIFLARAFNLKTESSTPFKDVSKNMAAYSSIKKIVHAGITMGHTDGTFKPESTLIRGQIAAFLARAMNPDFRPVLSQKRALYLDPMSKRITLKNLTIGVSKSDIVAKLGAPQKEYIDFDYNQELVQEYHGMTIYYEGDTVVMIIAEISEKEFFDNILPNFEGRKFWDRAGGYVLYSSQIGDTALYKYEEGKASVYLWWDYHFNEGIKSGKYGEYVEIN